MRRQPLLLPLTALATLVSARTAVASDWHTVLPGSPAAAFSARSAAALSASARSAAGARGAAETYLKHAAAELGLHGVSLRYEKELLAGAHRTVRFEQFHAGLPVLGASAAVRVAPDGRVTVVVLDVARDLSVPTAPKYREDAARKLVEATYGMTLAERPSASLAVFPEAETPGKLVWVVDVRSERGGDRYLVDAHTGSIVHRRPLAVDVRGRVYPISAAVTPEVEDRELTDLDAADPQRLRGWSGNLEVTNYVDGDLLSGVPLTLEQRVEPNSGDDFLYNPPTDASDAHDQFAQVGIYYHLTRMRDYFRSTHQLDMTSPRWKVVAVANMLESGRPMDNAFYSPQGVGAPFSAPNLIAIGQGSRFDFSDDSDVFLHEFTHYISSNAVGYNEGQFAINEYGLSPWGGSIDEGLADYFACSVNGDPTVGEASLELFGMERDLSDDQKTCPDDLFGEVHEDGEMIGSLAWALREKFGQVVGDSLVWSAMTLLTSNASLDDFARALQTAAGDLVSTGELSAADAAAVDAIIKSRGLDDCGEVLDLSGGKARRTQMFGIDSLALGTGATCQEARGQISLQSLFHFKSTPDPTAKGIRFIAQLQPVGGRDLEWNIYVRTARHVGFSSTGFLPEATLYDYSVKKITKTYEEIVIDETSDPPFDPAQTYYMVIGHGNCPASLLTVESEDIGVEPPVEPVDPVDPVEPETGSSGATPGPTKYPPAGPREEGCACRAGAPSAPAAPWAALSGAALAAAAVLRRRVRARTLD
ncbi:MYXO-CTERM sorting domain-containing protein [Sorangium sp. So ce1335]|uniref:MYXO-CTERM sorting domain-containing protein n=1 Tax=Sorangium sp. So ce1335 TaxID=3133335 RepID=UPI003F64580B